MTKVELEADFKLVTLSDLPVIQEYLEKAGYEESNHNLINMIQWADFYPLFQYRTEDYLLLLGIHQGQMFLYMPLCERQYFEEAIRKARSIFQRYDCPFVLSCFTKEMMELVIDIYPEYCGCHECAADDYVYEVESLKSFSGKKLQKKRNHLNAFYKEMEHRWVYESISRENAEDFVFGGNGSRLLRAFSYACFLAEPSAWPFSSTPLTVIQTKGQHWRQTSDSPDQYPAECRC